MTTALLAIVGVAVLFAVFGLMTRRWTRMRCGGCGDAAAAGGCGACSRGRDAVEESHVER